jgi:hypothetical protein
LFTPTMHFVWLFKFMDKEGSGTLFSNTNIPNKKSTSSLAIIYKYSTIHISFSLQLVANVPDFRSLLTSALSQRLPIPPDYFFHCLFCNLGLLGIINTLYRRLEKIAIHDTEQRPTTYKISAINEFHLDAFALTVQRPTSPYRRLQDVP